MRGITGTLITLSLSLASSQAFAHGGHVGESAGHSHWTALAAIGAVAILALLIARSFDNKSDKAKEDAASDTVQS
jgi:hypothetical protein